MKLARNTIAVLVVLCFYLLPSSAFASDLESVLRNVRTANGYPTWAASGAHLTLSGTAKFRGVESTFEQTFAPSGAYRYTMDGPFASTTTWDGSEGMLQERRGPVRPVTGEDLYEESLPYWIHCGYWAAEDCLRG